MGQELPIPVLKPNDAMFQAALAQGSRIGMLATFAPSVLTMTQEFEEFVRESGSTATLQTIVVEDAMDALRKGDADTHNTLVAARAAELADCDAIMLAHFSTSRAYEQTCLAVGTPVLTSPGSAVARVRALVGRV